MLLQADSSSLWHPVAYTSRRLRPEEVNYTAADRECLAVIHALRVWKLYLFKTVEVVTDNQVVTHLMTKKNLNKREARWTEFLADFDIRFVHKPGKENVADSLSRVTTPEVFVVEIEVELDEQARSQLINGYRKDKKQAAIIQSLQSNSECAFKNRYLWDGSKNHLYLLDDPSSRLCIPEGPLRVKLIEQCHDSKGAVHPGRTRTCRQLARKFFWPGMVSQVASLSSHVRYVNVPRVTGLGSRSFNRCLFPVSHGKPLVWI